MPCSATTAQTPDGPVSFGAGLKSASGPSRNSAYLLSVENELVPYRSESEILSVRAVLSRGLLCTNIFCSDIIELADARASAWTRRISAGLPHSVMLMDGLDSVGGIAPTDERWRRGFRFFMQATIIQIGTCAPMAFHQRLEENEFSVERGIHIPV